MHLTYVNRTHYIWIKIKARLDAMEWKMKKNLIFQDKRGYNNIMYNLLRNDTLTRTRIPQG